MGISLSEGDFYRFEQERVARLQSVFPELFEVEDVCLLDDRVVILAQSAAHVDEIVEELDILPHFVWLHTGRNVVSLYYVGEEIETVRYSPENEEALSSKATVVEKVSMPPATLEKPTEEKSPSTLDVVGIDEVVSQVLQYVHEDPGVIRDQILNGSEVFVKRDAAIQFIDRQMAGLAKVRESLASSTVAAPPATPARKPATRRSTAKKSPSPSKKKG